MQIFLEYVDGGIWDAIMSGPYILMHFIINIHVKKEFCSWNGEKNKKV